MNEEQELLQAVSIGADAEAFIKSSLGRAIKQRALDEIDQAVEELKTVDPTDAKKITELQNQIWRASAFIVWLAEIIQEGQNAEKDLNPEYSE